VVGNLRIDDVDLVSDHQRLHELHGRQRYSRRPNPTRRD
jgi:hypothetical protein